MDPYATLGVSPRSSTKDIKAAYRKKAFECHPDKCARHLRDRCISCVSHTKCMLYMFTDMLYAHVCRFATASHEAQAAAAKSFRDLTEAYQILTQGRISRAPLSSSSSQRAWPSGDYSRHGPFKRSSTSKMIALCCSLLNREKLGVCSNMLLHHVHFHPFEQRSLLCTRCSCAWVREIGLLCRLWLERPWPHTLLQHPILTKRCLGLSRRPRSQVRLFWKSSGVSWNESVLHGLSW